ncbi:Periplasmic hemin-binding protein [Methylophaga lonarensis MPL]|uniref:Periplasmic hemin-binding protein n=1 Tax=Methylophaga lonarensis MPL TaxID=1286106 RepID=M7PJU3_9GAMM|nr:ABC transporter substrate-binding protein [Methylophaga lonarensis]EMR14165.1 Periplasmic hemin-binding protein [Methylophaga lonarensis MPL]
MRIAQRKLFGENEARKGIWWKWAGLCCLLIWPQSAALADREIRIISVDANATELLAEGGLADYLVAVDMTSHSLLDNRQVADLGYHRNLSAEAILSLEPDLLIGSQHMGPESTLEILRRSGIEMIVLPIPLDTTQLMDNINTLANHFDNKAEFDRIHQQVAAYHRELNDTRHQHTSIAMTFLLQLNERGLSQAGVGTAGDALIKLLGGQNISRFANYKPVSTEALINENPQVIVLGSELPEQQAQAELLRQHPIFIHGEAFQNAQVYVVPPSLLIAGLSVSAVKAAVDISAKLPSASSQP